MADQIEEVKQKTDIVAIIGERIELKKAGRNFKAPCPFHAEKIPSFIVSPELQIYKCFGCGMGGDVFSFLQEYEGMDFPEALKLLADRAGIKLKPLSPGLQSEKEILYQINELAAKFYHYLLLNHALAKAALDYLLAKRGVRKQSIQKFGLGFAPNISNALTNFLITKKKFKSSDLLKAGVSVRTRKGLVDRFANRVIFPLFDHRGNYVGLAGRILPGDRRTEVGKYINSPDTPVYHKGSLLYGLNLTRGFIKKKNCAIVVEGELDLISSWQVGIKNIVALKGTALTEDQVRPLARLCQNLILTLDSDLAGDAAARRGINIAQGAGLDVRVAFLGDYKDPDDAARTAPQTYKKLLNSAISIWDFLINSGCSRYDPKTGEGKSKISRELAPVLASIRDSIVQAHYINVLAQRLRVPLEAVASQVESVRHQTEKQEPQLAKALKRQESRRQILEQRLLTLAFQTKPQVLLTSETKKLISSPLIKRILQALTKYLKTKKSFELQGFSKSLPQELKSGFSEMVLADLGDLADSEDKTKKEIDLIMQEIKYLSLKEKMDDLGTEISWLEKKGNKTRIRKAQKSFSELSRQLASLRV